MIVKPYHIQRGMALFYIAIFFIYLFGPLLVMAITAFNSSAFPRVSPWDCFSTQWFQALMEDSRLVLGFQRSLFIGAVVMIFSILLGLAGALLMLRVPTRVRSIYYTVLISPILIPGVVLGISTLIFWDRLRIFLGLSSASVFYDGIFLTIVGQTTFIASYCMLIFIARLQRFDSSLEEAALDLGATHVQAFRKVLLPFLKPAFASAAVIAFLASFENYNTTVFTILSKSTLTTELAGKVRYGINPSISALAVIIISVTLCGAICYEILKRRQERREAEQEAHAKMAEKMEMAGASARSADSTAYDSHSGDRSRSFDVSLVSVGVVLIVFAGIATFFLSNSYPNSACQEAVRAEKLERQQELIEQRRREAWEQQQINKAFGTPSEEAPQTAPQPRGDSTFGNVFAPQSLEQTAPQSEGN